MAVYQPISGALRPEGDLARLAGCKPAGVICEVMKDDGTMARLPDLIEFGREHGVIRLLIAPHLASRLGVASNLIGFAGCEGARYDDHLHIELE